MDYSPQMLLNIGNKNLSKEIYNDVLNDLQDYILDDNSIQRALQYTNILNTATGKYSNSNVNSNASNNSINNTEFIKRYTFLVFLYYEKPRHK